MSVSFKYLEWKERKAGGDYIQEIQQPKARSKESRARVFRLVNLVSKNFCINEQRRLDEKYESGEINPAITGKSVYKSEIYSAIISTVKHRGFVFANSIAFNVPYVLDSAIAPTFQFPVVDKEGIVRLPGWITRHLALTWTAICALLL